MQRVVNKWNFYQQWSWRQLEAKSVLHRLWPPSWVLSVWWAEMAAVYISLWLVSFLFLLCSVVPQEGRWRYPEGHHGLEGHQGHRPTERREPCGMCFYLLMRLCRMSMDCFFWRPLFAFSWFQATPTVVPTASALILRELKEPPRDRKKVKNIKHSGNVTLDAIINIARTMRAKSMAKKLKGTVLEVLGTAFAIGCSVNGQSPKDIQAQISEGTIAIPEAWGGGSSFPSVIAK